VAFELSHNNGIEDQHLPGYRGQLNRNCVTMAEVLGSADYFAVAAVRALTPRQYALSLLVATAAPTAGSMWGR